MEMGHEQAFLTKGDQSLDKTTSGPSGPFGKGVNEKFCGAKTTKISTKEKTGVS